MEKTLLRVTEAAERLSLSRSRAYELIASGELPSVRIGRSLRVPVAALDAWVESLSGPLTDLVSILRGND